MSSRGSNDASTTPRERALRSCTNLAGAELAYPFGEAIAVFKVGGRMFAVVSEGDVPARITLKCDPDYASYLVQQFDAIVPGYHMNKRHWITIALTPSMSEDLVDELISDAYDLLVAAMPSHARRAFKSPER